MQEKVIKAAIVHYERNMVIVDENGNLPELEFQPEHGTIEDTLFIIGHMALANVGYISPDYGYDRTGNRLYQTKPVPKDAQLNPTYRWALPPVRLQ